jgi:hypothetical protein
VWGKAGLIGSFMHPFPVKVITSSKMAPEL